ncbi:MAG: nitrate- and nitrite sensing domain-containing protein [Cellvibrionaceae bacterium]|nr:nitrate- and nitrite sensing domain-containing protein [Cellvibrionaceae bacterium]
MRYFLKKQLSKLPIAHKLTLIFLPTTSFFLICVLIILLGELSIINDSKRARDVVDYSQLLDAIAHNHAVERGLTAGFLASKGSRGQDKLSAQRQKAAAARDNFSRFYHSAERKQLPQRIQEKLTQLHNALAEVPTTQQAVDRLDPNAKAFSRYSAINTRAIEAIAYLNDLVANPEIAQLLTQLTASLWLKERAGQERGALNAVFVSGVYNPQKIAEVYRYIQDQHYHQSIIEQTASRDSFQHFTALLSDPQLAAFAKMRQHFLDVSNRGDAVSADPGVWFAQSTKRIGKIKQYADQIAAYTDARSKQKLHTAWAIFIATSVVSALLTLLLFLTNKLIIQQMSTSIKTLIHAIYQTQTQANFATRAEIVSDDELGDASKGYNQLMENLEQSIVGAIDVMQDVARGKFDKKIELDLVGDLARLKKGINSTAEKVEFTMNELANIMSALEAGDFTARVSHEVEGELKAKVDTAMNAMEQAIAGVSQVMAAMNAGNFNERIAIELNGDLDTLKQNVNNSMESIALAIEEISSVMTAQQNGDYSPRVTGDYRGSLNAVKQASNDSMDSISAVIYDISHVFEKVRNGDLKTLLTTEMPGDLETIKHNINETLTQIKTVIGDINTLASKQHAGDLCQRITGDYKGAFAEIADSLNNSMGNLSRVIAEVQDSAQITHNATAEQMNASIDMSERTEKQAASLEEVSSSIEQISASISATDAQCREFSVDCQQTAVLTQSVVNSTNDTVIAMEAAKKSSEKIVNIISMIDEIAFQTNLLALNAAVEAARAGEQGRGFAVVAQEVRSLSLRSSDAAGEIKTLINESSEKANKSFEMIQVSDKSLKQIAEVITEFQTKIGTISSATEQQDSAVKSVKHAITSLDDMTQANAAMVEEMAASARSMTEQSTKLTEQVNFFNLSRH